MEVAEAAGCGPQVLRPPGALPAWLHLPAPGHTDRLLRHQVYSDLLQVRGYAEYYCNSTRMSSHFQLYICITWKFNLLSTLGTRPAPWLPGWPASTSPPSPASTSLSEVLAAFQQPKFQAVFYEDFHNLCWSRCWAFR